VDSGTELVLFEAFKNDSEVLFMFLVIVAVDENVIKVYHHTDVDQIAEYLIHECLKSRGCITEAERHYEEFEMTVLGSKGGLVFVALCHADEVISRLQIDFGEDSSISEAVKELHNVR